MSKLTNTSNIDLLSNILDNLNSINIELLMKETFPESWEDMFCNENGESDVTEYALMYNEETEMFFFLDYATKDNGWAITAESQNHWILIEYFSVYDIMNNEPKDWIDYRINELINNIQEFEENGF